MRWDINRFSSSSMSPAVISGTERDHFNNIEKLAYFITDKTNVERVLNGQAQRTLRFTIRAAITTGMFLLNSCGVDIMGTHVCYMFRLRCRTANHAR